MKQKTKLEIIGPYTPEHEGPFCTRGGQAVRLITRTDGPDKYPIVGVADNDTGASVWDNSGSFFGDGQRDSLDLMNAREVPVAREFYLVGGTVFNQLNAAKDHEEMLMGRDVKIIHVREVLPGDE